MSRTWEREPGRRSVGLAVLWILSLATIAFGAGARSEEAGLVVERSGTGRTERLRTRVFEDQTYLTARDLARLVGASLHWRADVRKVVLRTVQHSLKLTIDSRWAVLDEAQTFQLSAPVRQVAGEIYVPVSTFSTLLSGRFVPQAKLVRGRLVLVADEPNAGPAELDLEGSVTRFRLPSQHPIEAGLVSARAGRFTLRVPGARLGAVPGDTLRGAGLISRVRFRREPENLWIELKLAAGSEGYRLRSLRDPERVELEIARAPLPAGFVELAPEFGAGAALPLRVLVLDPGHGGPDSGFVAARGVREKDLTLALARATRDELATRLPEVQVVLTRQGDEGLPPPRRVEGVNRVHADLYLSLHFDGMPGTSLAGITAYVAPPLGLDPATFVGGEETGASGRPSARPVMLVAWGRAAGRHHAEARSAAELLLASLAADGRGPARLRVLSTYVTQGADCPAVLLECGSLSREEERNRLLAPGGMRDLAQSLARALERYAHGEAWP